MLLEGALILAGAAMSAGGATVGVPIGTALNGAGIQAISTTIDTATPATPARALGQGQVIRIAIQVVTAPTVGTSVCYQLCEADDADLTSNVRVLVQTGDIPIANLPAGTRLVLDYARGLNTPKRFVGIRASNVGAIATHSITAAIVSDAQATGELYFKSGYAADPATPGGAAAPAVLATCDLGNDADDLGALDILIQDHKAGNIRLIAVATDRLFNTSSGGLRGFLDNRGMSAIPVLARSGGTVGTGDPGIASYYTNDIRNRFNTPAKGRADFPEAVAAMRQLIVNNSNVTLVQIGAATLYNDLLNSVADDVSPLNGAALITAKVSNLFIMAGYESGTVVEYNVNLDLPAMSNLAANWPTPRYWTMYEFGLNIYHGPAWTADPFVDAGVYGYINNFDGDHRRPSWDPLCAFAAILNTRGALSSYFSVSGPKDIRINSGTGATEHTVNASGKDYQLGNGLVDVGTTFNAAQMPGDQLMRRMRGQEVGALVQPNVNSFFFNLTEGTGIEMTADTGVKAYLGNRRYSSDPPISTTPRPTWLTVGGQQTLDFAATNLVGVPSIPAMNSGEFVFGMLLRPTNVSAGVRFIAVRSLTLGGQAGWMIAQSAANLSGRNNNAASQATVSGPTAGLAAATWLRLVLRVTLDSGDLPRFRWYLNGAAPGSPTTNAVGGYAHEPHRPDRQQPHHWLQRQRPGQHPNQPLPRHRRVLWLQCRRQRRRRPRNAGQDRGESRADGGLTTAVA